MGENNTLKGSSNLTYNASILHIEIKSDGFKFVNRLPDINTYLDDKGIDCGLYCDNGVY